MHAGANTRTLWLVQRVVIGYRRGPTRVAALPGDMGRPLTRRPPALVILPPDAGTYSLGSRHLRHFAGEQVFERHQIRNG